MKELNEEEYPKRITKKLVFLAILFVLGGFIEYFGFQDSEITSFNVADNNSIDYKVFLRPNEFFDEPYLGSGRTYITSLIDHIDIDFKHNETFSENASGSLSYYLVATISADRNNDAAGDGAYWSKDYQLTEPTEVKYSDTGEVNFTTSTSVSYAHYNSILESFREQYPVASEGTLKISLVANNSIKSKDFSDPLGYKSESSLSLPLLERAVEAKVNLDTGGQSQEFKASKPTNNPIYLVAKILGLVLMGGSIVLIILDIINRRKFIIHNQYISLLNKILEANDSIITNIENMPSLSKYQKLEVETFEELLDAYNEVRSPINFYQNKNGTESTFFITNDNLVWVYHLKKSSLGS